MQQKRKYLEELFQKYQQGQVTEEEKEIIAKWLTHLDVNNEPLTNEQLQARQQLSRQALKDQLFSKPQPATTTINFTFWLRSVAAVLLITTALFFYLKNIPRPQVAPIAKSKPIFPGGNKAILTLDDGTKINLNDAQNGTLAQQGNVTINKLTQGQLTYVKDKANDTTAVVFNTISTPKGGQYQVTLPDGTKVWLNAESSIRFPTAFTTNTRDVAITGEVYFEVTKNKTMPFNVNTRQMQIQVLGTHFNVMAYPDEAEIKTTLLEGLVKIHTENATAFLTPGQQGTVMADNRNVITVKNDPDAADAMAWKDGYFIFNNENMVSIMKKITRWYDVDVSYKGKVTNIGFNGTISRYANAEDLFKLLELTKAVNFKTNGTHVIVLPGTRK